MAPALGGRLAEPPAGGALPGAPAAGGVGAPPGAVPGPPAAGPAAALGGVAPAAGLGGLVAALGGPAAGAPAGVLVPAAPPPAGPAAACAAAAVAPGVGAAPAGAAVGAPVPGAADAAAVAAPPPVAFGGVPADARTLPVVYDMVGNRRREFRDAVLACREDQWEGWPVRGPRATHWVLRYIVDHGGTPTGMHSRWRSEARLQEHEPGVQEHERACRALEELLCFDQCNGANLAAAELLARTTQVQQERYRDRSAGGTASVSHDNVDAHLFMGSELTRGGVCACPLLQEWASLQLAKEQALLKERRKAREERELAKKGNKKKNNREEEG
ncbi:unnamed protein product [Prorocentrum cordatum]|uniref:Uncharacterized protein n=1 Tax=Prorocentrum cordatum TaxID=2364126 RepID=A0ABN9PUI5_9DINO|nr:unnamed protein product [Polarella glacialis]